MAENNIAETIKIKLQVKANLRLISNTSTGTLMMYKGQFFFEENHNTLLFFIDIFSPKFFT